MVIQYLIGKLLDMVNIREERLVVAALIAPEWKLTIYYVSGALLIPNARHCISMFQGR